MRKPLILIFSALIALATLSADRWGGSAIVDTFSTLLTYRPTPSSPNVWVLGDATIGDWKYPRLFIYEPANTNTANGTNIFDTVTAVGRWVFYDVHPPATLIGRINTSTGITETITLGPTLMIGADGILSTTNLSAGVTNLLSLSDVDALAANTVPYWDGDSLTNSPLTLTDATTLQVASNLVVLGTNTAKIFIGDGSGLTNLALALTNLTDVALQPRVDGEMYHFDATSGNVTNGGPLTITASGATLAGSLIVNTNVTAQRLIGQSPVVVDSAPVLSLSQTWNDATEAFTGVLLNVTNTASTTNSSLLAARVLDTNVFRVNIDGRVVLGVDTNRSYLHNLPAAGAGLWIATDKNAFLQLDTDANESAFFNVRSDNATIFQVAETGDVAVNSGELTVTSGTTTTDDPAISVTQTFNSATTDFTAIRANITDTASTNTSKLLDLQVGAASVMNVRKDGLVTATSFTGEAGGLTSALPATNSTQLVNFAQLGAASAVGEHFYFDLGAPAAGFTLTGTVGSTNWAGTTVPAVIVTNTAATFADGTYVAAFISTNTFTSIGSGTASIEVYAFENSAGAGSIAAEVYLVNSVTLAEEFEFTPAPAFQVVPAGATPTKLTFTVSTTDYTSTTNLYVMVKLKVSESSTPDPTIRVVSGGAYNSHVSFPVPLGQYVRKSGDTMTGDLTVPNVTVTTKATASGFSVNGLWRVFRKSPLDNEPTTNSTGYATLDIRGDGRPVLDFDTAVEESAIFSDVLPEGILSTTTNYVVKLLVAATNPTDTNNIARFGVSWYASTNGINADTWANNAEGNVTLTTNALSYWLSLTNTGVAVAAGEQFRLKVYRDIGDAADTVTNDVELLDVVGVAVQ